MLFYVDSALFEEDGVTHEAGWVLRIGLAFQAGYDTLPAFNDDTQTVSKSMTGSTRYLLQETDIPSAWYNIVADLPAPVLHPGSRELVTPADLAPLFPLAVIEQEMSAERYIDIPRPVREILAQWRPSPLYRARRLEKSLDTPARIYYKYEGVSPAGFHKPNTAVAQAFYAKDEGVKRITTETGAEQWGSALAFAGAFFDLDIEVYMMVKVSFDQKPYRRAFMDFFHGKPHDQSYNERELAMALSGLPSAAA